METMGGRLSGGQHSRAAEWSCAGTASCAKDSRSVAVEMHNTFAENAVPAERALLKAIPILRIRLKTRMCI